MLRLLSFFLVIAACLGRPGAVLAEPPPGGREPLRQWQQIPPEERREIRQQLREHWQQGPREERDERYERREEGRNAFHRMPREDRLRLRDELREQRNEWIEHPDRRPAHNEQRRWRR